MALCVTASVCANVPVLTHPLPPSVLAARGPRAWRAHSQRVHPAGGHTARPLANRPRTWPRGTVDDMHASVPSRESGWREISLGPSKGEAADRDAQGRQAGAAPPTRAPCRPQLCELRAGRGPGRPATRQEVPKAALSMLSGSVCAGVGSTLPAASPARQTSIARLRDRGPPAVSMGWGAPLDFPGPPDKSARRIPPSLGPGTNLPSSSSPLDRG